MADIDIKLLKELDEGIKRADSSLQNFSKTLSTLGTQYNKAFENSTVLAGGLRKELDALSDEIKGKSADIAKAVNKVSQDFANVASVEGKALSDKMFDANAFRKSAEDALNAALSVISGAKGQTQQLLQQSIAGISGLDINTLPTAMRRKILQRQAEVERESFETRTNPDFSKLNKAQYDAIVAALGNYKKAIDQLTDAQNKANAASQRYNDIASKLKKVPEEYDKIILQADMLKQKFSDLQVMKMAGILDEKEFKRVSQVILNQYDELIKKKKAFELTDIDRASNKRKKDQAYALRLQQRYYADIKRKEDEIAKVKQQHKATEKKMATNTSAEVKKAVEDQYKSEQAYIRELERQLKRLQAWRNYASKVSGVSNDTALSRGTRAAEASAKRRYDAERQYANAVRQTAEAEARAAEKRHRQALQASRDFNTITSTVRKLAAALGLTASLQGIANFGRKLIEVRGEFELQQVALRSILQNKQLADEIWDKTMQAALQSPFTAMQLTTYTKQLAAYRIETEKLFDTTKRLADVSAGLGVDMQRLILAYGQVKAANYLRASEIRQFTEAGVNILGELAHYFSDTREKMYSTAEIMDMVQKRMVKFEDVEAIFKRMTDAGGIFYNMQYVQSQTVKGQINKLHDAYDQMLNSIGKANTGALRNMVSLLLNIVKNWREWKTVLDSIAIPAFIIVLIKFGKGLMTAGASARIASNELRGLELAGTKARLSLAALNRTMKGFKFGGTWGLLGIGAAITALAALYNHAEAVRATNKEYDEQKNRLRETIRSFEDYQKRVENNNEIIRNRTTLSKDDADAQKKVTDAQEDNKKILNKLTADYPEYAKQIKIATDKQIDLGTILSDTNEKLREQAGLLEASKAGFGYEDVKENVEEYQAGILKQQDQAENNYQIAINARQDFLDKRSLQLAELRQQSEDLEKAYKNGEITERKYNKSLESIDKERNKILSKREPSWITRFIDAGKDIEKQRAAFNWGPKFGDQRELSPITGNDFFWGWEKDVTKLEKDLNDNLDRLTSRIRQMYVRQIEKLNEGTVEDVRQYVATNGTLVENWFKYGEGAGWKDINTSIVTWAEAMGVSLTETRQLIQKKISQTLGDAYGADLLIDWDAILNSAKKQTPRDNKEKTYKSFDKLLSLLKQMNSEYEKLSKSAYGYAKSEKIVLENYKDAFEEILGANAGNLVDWSTLDITSKQGLESAFKEIEKSLTDKRLWGKYGKNIKELQAKMKKAIADEGVEIGIDAQVRIKEDFGRQIEKMFGDYELTLNLASIGVPKDLAKELFGIDTSSLDEISAYMEDFATEHAEDWNSDINKIYIDALKKISDKEQEQYKKSISDLFKRVKNSAAELKVVMEQAGEDINFAKNLFNPNYVDEATESIKDKIKKNLEEIKKLTPSEGKAEGVAAQQIERLEAENKILQNRIERLSEMYGKISAEQYTDLVRSTIEWENERVQKISLEQLKKMPEYLEAMGRTAGWSNDKLREMLEYLENLISVSGSELNLEDYKTVINQIEKIQEQIRSNDYPFGREGFAKITQMLQEQNDAEQKLISFQQEQQELQEESKRLNFELVELQSKLNYLKSKNSTDDQDEIIRLQGEIENNLRNQKNNEDQQRKVAAGIQTITKGNLQTMVIIDAIIHAANDTVQDLYKSLEKIEVILQDYSIDTEHGDWAKWAKGMETFAKASQDATNGWEAFKKGDIAGIILEVVNGIVDIWHGINEIVNQKQVDTIYFNEEKIEDLKRAYERLEKQIAKTWDTVSYMQDYTEMTDNLYEQIEALNQQLAAEEAKKNTDKKAVQDYQDKIQDVEDELENLKQAQIEVFGGIGKDNYRSWAEGFVDAWKDAFLETGDGLDALQDHFDEFLQEWFVKQATMRIAGKALEGVMGDIDKVVSDNGVVDWAELQRIKDQMDLILPDLNDKLTAFAGMWDFGDEGGLSGLAAGIQGMTEEQANILEAYWNSVRMYTASIDGNVSRIAEMLGVGGPSTNPMLTQLQNIANNTAFIPQIYDLLNSVRRNNGNGQGFVTYGY